MSSAVEFFKVFGAPRRIPLKPWYQIRRAHTLLFSPTPPAHSDSKDTITASASVSGTVSFICPSVCVCVLWWERLPSASVFVKRSICNTPMLSRQQRSPNMNRRAEQHEQLRQVCTYNCCWYRVEHHISGRLLCIFRGLRRGLSRTRFGGGSLFCAVVGLL